MDIKACGQKKGCTFWKNAEIPIVIGVSAHRNINAVYEDKIKKEVGEVIEYFLRAYPNSPLLMLNGLAKGGDLLCAEVAKSKFEEGKPVRLCAVIPDKEELYLNGKSEHGDDFSKEDKERYYSIKNFETDNGRFVLDTVIAPDTEKSADPTRQYKFRQQAIYTATQCHVLLALWDGKGAKGSDGKGIKNTDCGTPAAVDFALRHNYIQPYGAEFYSAYDGAVIKIFAPREGSIDTDAGRRTYLTPENPGEESAKFPGKLNEILIRTELFNKNYHKLCEKQIKVFNKRQKKGQDAAALIEPDNKKFLIGREEYLNGGDRLKRIHDCCKVASELSGENKNKFDNSLKVLAVLGFLLLTGFMFYDQLGALWSIWLFLGLITLLIIGYLFLKALGNPHVLTWFKLKGKPCGVHTKFIEYRALSETLRVQYYLSACGVDYDVRKGFNWSHKNEIVWVKKAVAALLIGNSALLWENAELIKKYENTEEPATVNYGEGKKAKSACISLIFSKWAGKDLKLADKNKNGQIGYHLKTRALTAKKSRKRSIFGFVLILFTLAAYLTLFVLELLISYNALNNINLDAPLFYSVNGRMLFKISLSILSASAFALSYYYGKMSLNRIISDSTNMISLFGIAINRADMIFSDDLLYGTAETKEEAFNSLLKELAREQITENGIWLSYNRDNSLDLPL